MSGSQIKVNCIFLGQSLKGLFRVSVSLSDDVDILKEQIAVVSHFPRPATELFIWKLRNPIPTNDESFETAISRVWTSRQMLLNDATQPLSEIFDANHMENQRVLHVVVNPEKPSSPPVQVNWAFPRTATVQALYDKLEKYKLIHVRGTPASGKTTLSKLLFNEIRRRNPGVSVVLLNVWPENPIADDWKNFLPTKGYIEPSFLIIDEAQQTYKDKGFWNSFLKDIGPFSEDHVILFSSYGSPNCSVELDNPPVIQPLQRVSLQAVDHSDLIPPVALLLSQEDCGHLLSHLQDGIQFNGELVEALFHLTSGHVGAFTDLAHMIAASNGYHYSRLAGVRYTLEDFLRDTSFRQIIERLDKTYRIFRRGLPPREDLNDLHIERVFRAVLQTTWVKKDDFPAVGDRNALDICYKKGWLHSEYHSISNSSQDMQVVGYSFASNLHRAFVEYILGEPEESHIEETSLKIFAINVCRLIKSQNIKAPRHIGNDRLQRPPEAQYADEFYCACSKYTKVVTLPEFGTSNGRIDFFIPSKKWGIEILREGDRLAAHVSRFRQNGEYGKWISEGMMEDFVMLDFRSKMPPKSHPDIENLYHVVINTETKTATIVNNKRAPEAAFALTNE